MVDIQGVTVQFGDKKVLDNVSISFASGEMTGLVAPNGTGKSTLMNVVMNYLTPQAGKVLFKDGLTYSSKDKEVKIHRFVSMMPDQGDLYNHLSGRDHLKMYALMWKSDSKKIDETIKALNMSSYVDKKTGTYSLGMRQRLCFAMQIVADTEVMLMDEVMNGLDPNNVELISRILMQKKAEGKLIIIASHLLDNLEKYADRIYLMNNGQIVDVNEAVGNFKDGHLTVVRVKNMSGMQREAMQAVYPSLRMETLVNGYTIVYLEEAELSQLGELTTYLAAQGLQEFAFGKVTLRDLYAMYYDEVV